MAVTRHGYARPTRHVRLVEAGHPVPDAAGIAATLDTLDMASAAGPRRSGSGAFIRRWIGQLGGPAGALTLDGKQQITRDLLRSGATIGDINTVRKHLSAIKGGRLARRAAPARVVTLAISDVPNDDLAVIASGPTVPDPTTLADARALCSRFDIALPDTARALLNDPRNETPKPGDPVFDRGDVHLVARPQLSLEAAAAIARNDGYEVIMLGDSLEGEARELAADHARQAQALADAGRRAVLLSGGEVTVTLAGDGRGGPNQEYILAMCQALNGDPRIAALAGDTDGTDGGEGLASDPAGALCDPTSLARAAKLGLNAAEFLAHNNSTVFFEKIGDLLKPGPTFTNVNDFRAVIVDRPGLSTS